jgi:hypothetical protein
VVPSLTRGPQPRAIIVTIVVSQILAFIVVVPPRLLTLGEQ